LGGLEIFDMVSNETTAKLQQNDEPHAQIDVDVMDTSGFDKAYADALEDTTNVSWLAKSAFMAFKYKGNQNVPMAKRRSDLDDWQRGVSSEMKKAGLRELTQSEWAKSGVHGPADLREKILHGSPFGKQELFRKTLGPHIVALVNDDDESCVRFGYGFVAEPEDGVKEDYGGMMNIFVGIGDGCDHTGTLSDKFVNEIIQYVRARTKTL